MYKLVHSFSSKLQKAIFHIAFLLFAVVQIYSVHALDPDELTITADKWGAYPIYGGEMTSIAMDPVDPQTVYVGTRSAGVFKTIDGGQSWQPAREGLTFYPIRSLAVDPQNPDILYAGTDYDGIWKSTDGGDSWFKSSNGLYEGLIVFNIVINPENTHIVYAGLAGGVALAVGNIYRSVNSGATWEIKDAGIPRTAEHSEYTSGVLSLAIDSDNPSLVYVGTILQGAFRSEDGGETWNDINNELPFRDRTNMLGDRSAVNALAIDPHHNNRLSAAIDGQYYFLGEGDIWESHIHTTAEKITGPWLWMIVPYEHEFGQDSSLEAINTDSLAEVTSGVITEEDVARNGAKEGDTVGDLAWASAEISPDGRDNINDVVNEIGFAQGNVDHHSAYALITIESATEQQGVAMHVGTDQYFKVWLNGEVVYNNSSNPNRSSKDPDEFTHEFLVDLKAGDNLLLVKVSESWGYEWGILVGIEASFDAAGKDYEPVKLPKDIYYSPSVSMLGCFHLYFHPTDPGIIYSSGDSFLKSTNAGGTWTDYLGWSESGHVPDIAFHPSLPDTIYAITDNLMSCLGKVYKSLDQGETWSEAYQGINANAIRAVAIDPQDHNNIYVGTESGHFFRSHDAGTTWAATSREDSLYCGYYDISGTSDIAVDAFQNIYVAATRMHKSIDQGKTFDVIDEIGHPLCIAMSPLASNIIYAGTLFGQGIYKSSDGGNSWTQKNEGLPLSGNDICPILSLAINPSDPETIWAGTQYGGGIIKSTNGGDLWQVMGLTDENFVDTIAINPDNSDEIIVGAGFWDGRIYKSTDGGNTWQEKISGIAFAKDIVFDTRDSRLVYAATEGQGVLRSFDGGETWHDYSDGIFHPRLLSLDITEDDPPLLLAGSFGSGLYGIYPSSSVAQGIKGDVNNDGKIGSNDAILALRIASGLMTPSDEEKWAADVNDDGDVKANDAIVILRMAAGLAAPVRDIDKAGMIAISLDGGYDRENLNVSIRVDNFQVLNGGDICISYDSSALSQVEVVSRPGVMLASNVNEPGVVRISFAASDGLDNGTIASVKFDMLTDEVTQPVIKNVELYGRDAIPVNVRVKEGLMAAVPEHSELLQNYPNSFNPDTWIPYQLAQDVSVTIRIYEVSGRIVRTMNLGHKTAGFYTGKSKAAYWDGKNEAGEEVASGIYFYTIQAGDFTATKKMLIVR